VQRTSFYGFSASALKIMFDWRSNKIWYLPMIVNLGKFMKRFVYLVVVVYISLSSFLSLL